MFAEEFDLQVKNLLNKGYPDLAGISQDDFVKELEPLKEKLSGLPQDSSFLIVVRESLIPTEKMMEAVEREGKKGFTVISPEDLAGFTPIPGVLLPEGNFYLILNVDTGEETLNVTPDAALITILGKSHSPLTIAEGVAVVTHKPGLLQKNHCFSLPGSRCGDKRVAAIWISDSRPKLGWCWAGNPHTWLGSASCSKRI